MHAYRHFGLRLPPFEGPPAPAFFFAGASHQEALATAQFAARTGKSGVVILGASGSGKTLVARLLAESVNRTAYVLWIHGLGQPKGQTEISVYPLNTLRGGGRLATEPPYDAVLSSWVRARGRTRAPVVAIADNADALRENAWSDILALLAREAQDGPVVTLVALGTDELATRLGTPALARLRRRLFRICRLEPLSANDTAAYIEHRLATAGGGTIVFTPSAIEQIHRAARGNPAAINQICDSALIDAYGDERATIEAEHIAAAYDAICGPWRRPRQARDAESVAWSRPAARRTAPTSVARLVEDASLPTFVSADDTCVAASNMPAAHHEDAAVEVADSAAAGPDSQDIGLRAEDPAPDGPAGQREYGTCDAGDGPGTEGEQTAATGVADAVSCVETTDSTSPTVAAANRDPPPTTQPARPPLHGLESRLGEIMARVRDARHRVTTTLVVAGRPLAALATRISGPPAYPGNTD